MLFSSFEFIFYFLPITVIGYYYLNRLPSVAWAKLWLLFASLFFYGWWNPYYLPLLVGSICANYVMAGWMTSIKSDVQAGLRKKILTTGILLNIVLLGYFKYANFFVENINRVSGTNFFLETIVLPLGISFFTIQQIAFLMDAYEDIAKEKNFIDYSLFVTFFPHLLAGPILHHRQMMPQFREITVRAFSAHHFSVGLFLFAVGLFKKVVLADPLAQWVNTGYSLHEQMSVVDAWVTSLSYTFQLYFDFSGYVDMAIGIAWMFNIRLPKNFDSPYRATSVINFWERWHITLSKFITTYIYTPLIRNFFGRITFYKSMIATLVAMFIAGLWHGASWAYIAYGVFHGVGLVVNHIWRRWKIKLPVVLAWLLTFVFVNISFVIFRAGSLEQAIHVIQAMFGLYGTEAGSAFALHVISEPLVQSIPLINSLPLLWASYVLPLLVIAGLLSICLVCQNSGTLFERFQPNLWYVVQFIIFMVVPLFMMNGVTEFVYFQF